MSEWTFGTFEVTSVMDSFHSVNGERIRQRVAYAQSELRPSMLHRIRVLEREHIEVNPDGTAETIAYKVHTLAFDLADDDHISPGNKIELIAKRVCD